MGAPVKDEVLLEVGIMIFGQDLKKIRVNGTRVSFEAGQTSVEVDLDDVMKEGECPRPKRKKSV